jgi:predicted transcriptional regulator
VKAERTYTHERNYHSASIALAGRMQQSNGVYPISAGWERYRKPESERSVVIVDAWGRQRWITPTQARVLAAMQRLQADHSERVSMAKVAASLGVAPSTVYRAMLRLAAFGLIAYETKRGRSGGVAMVHVTAAELKQRAQSAWDRLAAARARAAARWRQVLERSGYPMSALIVAPIESSAQRLALEPWSAADMAEIDHALGL